ncbi:hypothetical protein B0A55_04174 [Friedmanniomyces simplex]|uniref:Ketoreductase domain-containing protein n=1 Tax=Friedmanniomyces simplex TaxID=329884 RepID=A0A4U0XN13_9PEZI|nr:hypothetical protein B0A55_04174 [Friedmanniomyces simplex]
MDADDLDYLEKRALSYSPQDSKQQRPQPRQHHSEALFGISLYGVIILCFLLFAGLFFYGIVHGFWHLCSHYSAHSAAAATTRGSQLMHIKDRTFVISGGASGLGLATVRDLHAQGGYIATLDLNAENGNKVVSELGDRTAFFEVDVSSPPSVSSAVSALVAWTKQTSKPIGGVIPAAGVGFPGKLIDRHNEPIPLENLELVLNINLRGVLDLIRLCLPHMTTTTPTEPDGERGVIIMVSSSAAFDGQPGQVAYAASKGAVRSMTLVLARDLAQYGIRAVSIAPSYFESGMTAAMSQKVRKSLEGVFEFPRRPGKGEDFARMVRQCVENPMLNGECIRLDGATRMPSRL